MKFLGQQNGCGMGVSWVSVLSFSLLWLIALVQATVGTWLNKPLCYENAWQAFRLVMELQQRAAGRPTLWRFFSYVYDTLVKFFPVFSQDFALWVFLKGLVRTFFSKSRGSFIGVMRFLRINIFKPKKYSFHF